MHHLCIKTSLLVARILRLGHSDHRLPEPVGQLRLRENTRWPHLRDRTRYGSLAHLTYNNFQLSPIYIYLIVVNVKLFWHLYIVVYYLSFPCL